MLWGNRGAGRAVSGAPPVGPDCTLLVPRVPRGPEPALLPLCPPRRVGLPQDWPPGSWGPPEVPRGASSSSQGPRSPAEPPRKGPDSGRLSGPL